MARGSKLRLVAGLALLSLPVGCASAGASVRDIGIHRDQFPARAVLPIDGQWRLTADGSTWRMQSGRLFLTSDDPQRDGAAQAVDVRQSGPRTYTCSVPFARVELPPHLRPAEISVEPERLRLTFVVEAKPLTHVLRPVKLDDQVWFRRQLEASTIIEQPRGTGRETP